MRRSCTLLAARCALSSSRFCVSGIKEFDPRSSQLEAQSLWLAACSLQPPSAFHQAGIALRQMNWERGLHNNFFVLSKQNSFNNQIFFMKRFNYRKIARGLALVSLLALFSFNHPFGGDSLEVFLNKKLLFRQYMYQEIGRAHV